MEQDVKEAFDKLIAHYSNQTTEIAVIKTQITQIHEEFCGENGYKKRVRNLEKDVNQAKGIGAVVSIILGLLQFWKR